MSFLPGLGETIDGREDLRVGEMRSRSLSGEKEDKRLVLGLAVHPGL